MKPFATILFLMMSAEATEREVPRLAAKLACTPAGDRAAARLISVGTDEALSALIAGVEEHWLGECFDYFNGHGGSWLKLLGDRLVPLLLRITDGNEDFGYVRMLAHRRRDALPLLLRDIHSRDPRTAQSAAVNLGRLHARRALATLTALLDSDPSAIVQQGAIEGLGALRDRRAIPALQRVLARPDEQALAMAPPDNPQQSCAVGICPTLHDWAREALRKLR